jgi:16S rRNA (uracil1498-N3)-methyltransferase
MHRFAVPGEAIRSGRIRLRGADLRRLRDVLRLRPGAQIEAFDRAGRAWVAEVVAVGTSAADLRVLHAIERRTESPLSLTLAVALTKGAKLDWVVEKTTELGVARIVPFASERTVPERESVARRLGRWRRIADAAAAQSGRAACPVVEEVATLSDVLHLRRSHDRAVLFWEAADSALGTRNSGPGPQRVLLITGAEGGFSQREAAAARESGCAVVGLGPRILRADTAAVAVVALAQFLWGDLGASR